MRVNVRETVTNLIELVAAAAVTAGVAMIYVPAGFITAGAAMFGLSYLIERKGQMRR